MGVLKFKLEKKSTSTKARAATVSTAHGDIQTPVFMPVGTLGSVKGLVPEDMEKLGAKIALSNAYHLMLRPGDELVAQMGGLHEFCSYKGAILTDSGGFQVYSLASHRKVDDEGITFRSHIDGSKHRLDPKRLVKLQENLNPDIAMVIDECPPANAERAIVEKAIYRSTKWATECLEHRSSDKEDLNWFGICQGALFKDLRAKHVEEITALPFDGFAIGGVSVGEAPEDIVDIVNYTAPLLPENKPRYLMGVGKPEDLVRGVAAGVDMFDCVLPSRNARNGTLYTSVGKVSIKRSENKDDKGPLDPNCSCYTCKTYSRAFLRHLFVTKELTFYRVATLHNISYYLELMRSIRQAILEDKFTAEHFLNKMQWVKS